MQRFEVGVAPASARLPEREQLAVRLAEAAVATATAPLDGAAVAMVGDRVIDNAAVAVAAIDRRPVAVARDQALAHRRSAGALLIGLPGNVRVEAEWAAWANGTAVRELDFHDTFLAADYAHPADAIPPLLAVAQQSRRSGAELVRAVLAAYEIDVALVKAICLHEHRIDHIAHLAPAVAAGLGALLALDAATTAQAIAHALHVSTTTRQSRKGTISSWKAFAPAHAGKVAIEAVDRAMRGERSPAPIYEGEDGVIAWLLDGPNARYTVELPSADEPRRAILATYTKAHSAEYQAQAAIDLAFRLRPRLRDALERITEITIHTSHHTHRVIGTGSGDPQKFDPDATRETLDHSLMYIFAVALEDGAWHHVDSYLPERAHRGSTVRLWRKIRTVEDPEWTRRYHATDPHEKALGARAVVRLDDGRTISDELGVADAHPLGAAPFTPDDYRRKFRTLAEGRVAADEAERFFDRAQRIATLDADALDALNVRVAGLSATPSSRAIFDA